MQTPIVNVTIKYTKTLMRLEWIYLKLLPTISPTKWNSKFYCRVFVINMTFKQIFFRCESYNYCNHQNLEGKKRLPCNNLKSKTIKTKCRHITRIPTEKKRYIHNFCNNKNHYIKHESNAKKEFSRNHAKGSQNQSYILIIRHLLTIILKTLN
jgi:hypothetical protein